MMDFVFDLTRHKGGSSSTTSRNIPNQTEQEAALEDYLLKYSTGMGELSKEMLLRGYDALGGTFTPNWESKYNEYKDANNNDFRAYQDWSLDRQSEYDNKMDDYNSYFFDKSGDYQAARESGEGDYEAAMRRALSDYEGANNEYKNSMRGYLSDYDRGMQGVTSRFEDLVNGVLPSAYAANRQAALNADLKGTMGSSVNSLANRGVINSSVTNKAFNDISQSASDTLAKRYADDLALEASLVGQQGSNYQNIYNTRAGNAGSLLDAAGTLYGNRTSNAGNILNAQRDLFNDQMSTLSANYSNYSGSADKMYNAQAEFANNWINNANAKNEANFNALATAQQGSFQPVDTYLNYASTLSAPAENLYNTMYSGRMGTGSTTTKQSDGGSGMWSAVGGLGSALVLACFTGDTLVTTVDGYKYIKDIVPGDIVLSVRDGEITPKVVTTVSEPRMARIMKVIFSNGTIWHTTENQRFYDGRHFRYAGDDSGRPALVHGGTPAYVIAVEMEGKEESVYDIVVEGHAGENVFFANDVAAEGLGD